MKISYHWLKEYLPIERKPEEISDILTDIGLEVEGLESFEQVKGGLLGVVVGHVLTCEQHPNADRLRVTTVDVGGDTPLNIVCGAPNVAVGQKVLVATIGTELHSGEETFKIKKGKIRGEVSEGMICAEDELGLGESHDGIMVLDASATPGTAAADQLGFESIPVFEIGLTPNRADAMGHYGVARDLRAALKRRGEEKLMGLPSIAQFKVDNTQRVISVEIENKTVCPHYMGLTLTHVKVGPSPEWLQTALKSIGLSPINNIVDITNYVLHETGHPLHAFDADEIKGQKVVVKTLAEGTSFTTLDDKERKLNAKDLVICDGEGTPMCLAGVLGGAQSGVTQKTQTVFLESALFNTVSIRKTAKRHALNTDASFRYERGVDASMTDFALKRAASLMMEIAGAKVSSEIQEDGKAPLDPFNVTITIERVQQMIGQEISKDLMYDILQSLDIKVIADNGREWHLEVPNYRVDVTREADVIEEILRIYGFNHINLPNKMAISVDHMPAKSKEKLSAVANSALVAMGSVEIKNNSLTKAAYYTENPGWSSDRSVAILNPLSQDLGVMRQTLLYGGLESIAYNQKRRQSKLHLHEFGKTYGKSENGFYEGEKLCLWMAGDRREESWIQPTASFSFYSLKGEVEALAKRLGIGSFTLSETSHSDYSNAFALSSKKISLGTIGIVEPKIAKSFDIITPVLFADLNWDQWVQLAQKSQATFSPISVYPEVRRDLALLLDNEVSYETLEKIALQTERKILKEVSLFDVYQGKKLPAGKKSYALSFILQDENKTLTDKQVEKTMQRILDAIQKEVKAELR